MLRIAALAAALVVCAAAPAQADPVSIATLWLAAEIGLSYGATTIALAVAPYIVGSALILGASLVTKALLRAANGDQSVSGSGSNISENQATIKQTVAARRRHYGRVKCGGVLAFYAQRNGVLYALILVAQGNIAGFIEYWLNQDIVTLDAGGFVLEDQYRAAGGDISPPDITTDKTARARIQVRYGDDDQTAYETLITVFPEVWTDQHRLLGVAHVLLSFRNVPNEVWNDVYPQGAPTFRTVIGGARVFDPRLPAQSASDKTTWQWSDNPALCILDYLTHADGMGRDRSLFDEASFAAAATACEQRIPLKTGGSEDKYNLNGSYALDDKPSDVLTKMLAVCDGQIVQNSTDGTYGLKVGVWEGTNVTITDNDVLSFEMTQGSDALSAFNRLKITYCSPAHDDQDTEGQAWEDEANIALVGEIRTDDLTLSYCQSHSQARRIAKIAMHRGNPDWKGTVRTNLAGGLRAMGQRIIRLQLSELSIDETFAVAQLSIAGDLSYCDMTVSSLSEDAYDWNPAAEEGDAPDTANPIEIVAAANSPKNFQAIGAWDPMASPPQWLYASWDEVPGFSYELQLRYYTHDNWDAFYLPVGTVSYTGQELKSGYTIYVRIRSISPSGIVSDWSKIDVASYENHS